jgi:phosphatidyl-myo-inositol alpha-mannosyltransferase
MARTPTDTEAFAEIPVKIALVSPYDYAAFGGVSKHITSLAVEFERVGHEVHIIAPCTSGADVEAPVPLHRLGTPVSIPANGSVARISAGTRLGGEVKQILRSVGFDIIHLHEPLLPALPLAVLRASRATNVGTFHAYRQTSNAYFYAKPFLWYFYRRLHGKIAVSAPARDFVAERFPGDYRIIPNGIDRDRYSRPYPPIPWMNDGRPNVLFVGRLEKRKGLSYLMRAWAHVTREFPEARLVVVGGGRGLKHYRGFVDARGVDNIVFTGMVPDEELPRYYQSAQVFCAPSTGQESFGIVLLEAMAAGTPIVATSNPGYCAVVTHGREGMLVPPKDSESLGGALIHLLADPDLRARLSEEGRRTSEQYAWPRVAGEVLAYYEECIHRRKLLAVLRRPRFRRMRRVASGMAHLLNR